MKRKRLQDWPALRWLLSLLLVAGLAVSTSAYNGGDGGGSSASGGAAAGSCTGPLNGQSAFGACQTGCSSHPENIAEAKRLNPFAGQWNDFCKIIMAESKANGAARGPYVSGKGQACGLGQALPCSKLTGKPWRCSVSNRLSAVRCQLRWMIDYIKRTYKNAANAWSFWKCGSKAQDKDHPVPCRQPKTGKIILKSATWY